MEVASFFFLALPLLAIILTIALFRGNGSDKNLPPGSLGLPVIGESIPFLFGNPEKFVVDRMKKYSPEIFKTNILGEKMVVICGPNGHKFLFSNEQKLFTAFRPPAALKLVIPDQVTPAPIQREMECKMINTPGFLKPEALVRYVGKMDLVTQEQMRAYWEGKDEVKAHYLAKTLTLTLASLFFLGIDDPDRIAKFIENFDCVAVGIHSVPLDFPGTAFYKAKKVSPVIRKELGAVINEKKAALASGSSVDGLSSQMLMFTHFSEDEIAKILMGFLTAGYYTVASAMAFFMKYVGERPEIYDKILAEQMKISAAKNSEGLLEWDDFSKMKYSWNVILEVMRLAPPLQGTFREVLTDCTYAGYTIPKGWKVYWTVSSTNKNPEYFLDPEKFDPSRYDDDKKLPPFTFVSFGGGPRMCPGKEYSRLVILTFVHNVVKRFRWELVCPEEKDIAGMIPAPAKGLPIRLVPHN